MYQINNICDDLSSSIRITGIMIAGQTKTHTGAQTDRHGCDHCIGYIMFCDVIFGTIN
jgi:hypothetical protein